MNEMGFLPLTTAGLILLILAVSVSGYYQWNEHRTSMKAINDHAYFSLNADVGSRKNDIKRQVRETLYDVFWTVGKNVDSYEGKNQENWIEFLAEKSFRKRLSLTVQTQGIHPRWSESSPKNGDLKFEINQEGEGYPQATIKFAKGTSVYGTLPDNTFFISQSIENLETSVDARFYLLKERMNRFEDDLDGVEKRWKYAEYAMAYAQAWAGGKIHLSGEITRILFQLALASQEIDKFGSADYKAIMQDLIGLPSVDQVVEGYNSNVTVDPLRENFVQTLKVGIEDTLFHIGESAADFQNSVSGIEELTQFQFENWFKNKLKELSVLQEKVGNADSKSLNREFRKICENFRSIYTLPTGQVERASESIREAKLHMMKARKRFQDALRSTEELSNDNPLAKQLYEDLVQEGDPPGMALQVKSGTNDVLEEFDHFEEQIQRMKTHFQILDNLGGRFPANFERLFEEALKEDNRRRAENILSEASASAIGVFEDFEESSIHGLTEADSLYRELNSAIADQVRDPKANWREEYEQHPQPGENCIGEIRKRSAEKYVIYPGKGTIGGLERVLENAKSHLELFEDLNKELKKQKEELKKLEIDKDLREKLKKNLCFQFPDNLTREEFYELSPPTPLKSDPGLSVYHEVEVESVEYKREDPAGLVHGSAPPTPIYLWFIGVTLYWAQWNVGLELKEPILEEIFDYKNQTIPKPIVEGSKNYIHKPLPYRREFPKTEFNFRLIVVGLRPFIISAD